MQRKKVGKSDVLVSEITLGTWAMGGTYWGPADDEESIRAIHKALDSGMNTLDTAEAYNNGYSERVIGRAIRDRKNEVVISTKAANYHSSYRELLDSCHRSLQNLGRDYIDIYYLHWPSSEFGHDYVPLEESLEAIAKLKQEGKIRAFGLSNFAREDFEKAKTMVEVDAWQPPFNILWRSIDPMVPYCLENTISIFPYASVAQGLLTGRIAPGYQFAEGDKRNTTPLFQPENLEKAYRIVMQLQQIAHKHHKTIVQLVLRWTIQAPGITSPLVGGRTDGEIADALGALDWELPQEDYDAIDALSKAFFQSLPHYKHYFSTEIIP